MSRGGDKESIPTDLIFEIFSRLPAKSVARCRCLSKRWGSMLLKPHFTELFLTRSLARPRRLLFALKGFDRWCFMTSPQPDQNPLQSLVVVPDFHLGFPGEILSNFYGLASGFISFHRETLIGKDLVMMPAICNPTTGQYVNLSLPSSNGRSFLGFDPIDKQFKVLHMNSSFYREHREPDQILTLGTRKDSWRKIHCPTDHFPEDEEGICIDGVLYYLATQKSSDDSPLSLKVIACFDVRSETFKFIHRYFNMMGRTKLINYKGKLGMITMNYNTSQSRVGGCSLDLSIWVTEDVEKPKPEWSKYASFFWDDEVVDKNYDLSIVGMTAATGEIVLSTKWDAYSYCPFYLFYLNPARNTVQRVEIKGLSAKHNGYNHHKHVKVFVDYVEDLKFLKMKTTSIRSPYSKAHLKQGRGRTFVSINKFDYLRLTDDDDDVDDDDDDDDDDVDDFI